MKKFTLALMMIISVSVMAQQPFTEGNFVVLRAGDGSVPLANTGNKIFLDEYTTSGTLVRSIEIPSAGTGKSVINGTNDTEGTLTRSPNGLYITFFGYDAAAPYASSILSAAPGTVNRVVTWLNNAATISYLPINDYPAGGQAPRAAITTNGTDFWMASGSGIGYRAASATGTTIVATITAPSATSSFRTVSIADGNLFASTTIGTGNVRVGQIGSGLPTSATTYNPLSGIETNITPHQFAFADLDATVPGVDVLYICDETTGSNGGIRKYSLVGTTWIFNGIIGAGEKYRHLIYQTNGSSVTFFATRQGGNAAGGGGSLVTVTDNTGYNVAPSGFTVIELQSYSNTSNIALRGIAWAPTANVLPLTLKSFNAALYGSDVKIWWQTINEVNVKNFTIEKSMDGKTFTSMATVAATNMTMAKDYVYTDFNLLGQVVFYRLKITDNDGSFKYSHVIRVSKTIAEQIRITPNPLTDNVLRITHTAATAGASLNIFTIDGRLLQNNEIAQGSVYSSVMLNNLPAGTYILQFVNGNTKQTSQFIKK